MIPATRESALQQREANVSKLPCPVNVCSPIPSGDPVSHARLHFEHTIAPPQRIDGERCLNAKSLFEPTALL